MHDWNVSVQEALDLQERLQHKVILSNGFDPARLKTVAGIDASYADDQALAVVCVLSFPELTLLEQAKISLPNPFPYVPGLFSFREGPAVLKALETLTLTPDLLIFDGHGYAHLRRFGLASHIGVYLDCPAIGCAKTRLVGEYAPPGPDLGDFSPLTDTTSSGQETIGAVVRTRPGSKPLFVSVGHKIDLPTAIQIILKCLRGHRLPEPIRLADQISKEKYIL
ncbi:MAG: deoxyribonuclease V [Chloroflexi bacterium]|nr:deoxyribonuclease V [Chloroflexota bacterium]OJW06537.1 MAG: hypothetical protein BGO39_00555 [Chloroflexi bacterium 54-19]